MLQVTHSEHLTGNIKESERHFPAVDTEVTWQDLPSVEGVFPVPTLDIVLIALLLSVDFVLPFRSRLVAQAFHDLDLALSLDGGPARSLDSLGERRCVLLQALFTTVHGDGGSAACLEIERRQRSIVDHGECAVAFAAFTQGRVETLASGAFGGDRVGQFEATCFEFVLAQIEHSLQTESKGAGHQPAASAASSASV